MSKTHTLELLGRGFAIDGSRAPIGSVVGDRLCQVVKCVLESKYRADVPLDMV